MARRRPRTGRPYMPGYGITPGTPGAPLAWTWALERLEASRNYWVTTVRQSGVPHSRPVWGVWVDGVFFFSTGSTPRIRALAQDPRCVVTTEDAREAVIVEGVAERRDTLRGLTKYTRAYEAKYAWRVTADLGPLFLVRPSVAFGFIEHDDLFSSTATRWQF